VIRLKEHPVRWGVCAKFSTPKVFLTLDDISTISGGFENIEGIIE
jgi:hypothetical protein